MKSIILFSIIISNVFAWYCPPAQVIHPCTCVDKEGGFFPPGMITCNNITTSELKLMLTAASKNETKKWGHFVVLFPKNRYNVLEENQFANITFESMALNYVNKIHVNSFGKTAKTLQSFGCNTCHLENSPPNYDLWKSVAKLTNSSSLSISTNITEIPTNAIVSVDGKEPKLKYFWVDQWNNVSIKVKSGAFHNLNLDRINLWVNKISKIESGAFRLDKKSDKRLIINFLLGENFTSDSFENGTFNGIQRERIDIFFEVPRSKIDYLPEHSFKSVLDLNKNNTIQIYDVLYQTTIDCSDCRNYWLIRDNKKAQLYKPMCSEGYNPKNRTEKLLFDDDIVSKLKTKCKTFLY